MKQEILVVNDGDSLLLTNEGGKPFSFYKIKGGEDTIQIHASEILILTPKAVKWYKLVRFWIGLVTCMGEGVHRASLVFRVRF